VTERERRANTDVARELLGCAALGTRSAARAATVFYDDALEPSGLRITQFAILAVLNEGIQSMSEVASALGLDPTTLSRTLQPLQDDDLVIVKQGSDRRNREVLLSAAGRRKVAEAHALWRAAHRDAKRRFGVERFDRLVSELGVFSKTLRRR
jgi:DNA-binding MarR family transcriptional regulator